MPSIFLPLHYDASQLINAVSGYFKAVVSHLKAVRRRHIYIFCVSVYATKWRRQEKRNTFRNLINKWVHRLWTTWGSWIKMCFHSRACVVTSEESALVSLPVFWTQKQQRTEKERERERLRGRTWNTHHIKSGAADSGHSQKRHHVCQQRYRSLSDNTALKMSDLFGKTRTGVSARNMMGFFFNTRVSPETGRVFCHCPPAVC